MRLVFINKSSFGFLSALLILVFGLILFTTPSCTHEGIPADQMEEICFIQQVLDPWTYNVLSVGVDIETEGHVFQLMLTNKQGMREGTFIPVTTGSWDKGDIHLGFNISRVFAL